MAKRTANPELTHPLGPDATKQEVLDQIDRLLKFNPNYVTSDIECALGPAGLKVSLSTIQRRCKKSREGSRTMK
jgi:hypothetical protein